MIEQEFIKYFIRRLSRIDANEARKEDLNPAQKAALEYLARANRYSRSPSQVAEFLGSTRGTVSQTLKSLMQKGYLEESKSEHDQRSISYHLSDFGWTEVEKGDVLGRAMGGIPSKELLAAAGTLRRILDETLKHNGQRSFGLCRNCKYFTRVGSTARCILLDVDLATYQHTQICYEQEPLDGER